MKITKIKFIPELIKEYATIPALFLANSNPEMSEISDDIQKTDWIGVTIMNDNSLKYLRKARLMYPDNKIIAGGIGVLDLYDIVLKTADYIYIGEAFDFNYDSLVKRGQKSAVFNEKITWENIPIIQIGKRKWYLLTEIGCPFKCDFCNVSNCQSFKQIPSERFFEIMNQFDTKYHGQYVHLISNEGIFIYQNHRRFKKYKKNMYVVESVPLKMFLQNMHKGITIQDKTLTCRFGVELPTEALRKKFLPPVKKITDDELREILYKLPNKLRRLHLFYLWNYLGTELSDYDRIFEILIEGDMRTRVDLKFTTQYMMMFSKNKDQFRNYINRVLTGINFKDTELCHRLKNITQVRVIHPCYLNKSVEKMFITYLPSRFEIPKPKGEISAFDYFEEIKLEYKGENLINIMEKRLNNTYIKNGRMYFSWE